MDEKNQRNKNRERDERINHRQKANKNETES